jgi:hypothetical protein
MRELCIFETSTRLEKMKRSYQTPMLDRIELDNDISLVLASKPGLPGDPENMILQNEFLLEDPIMTDFIIGL